MLIKNNQWLLTENGISILASSENPLGNAARAIAVCAYPTINQRKPNGKAHSYANALLCYLFRVARQQGYIERLPQEVINLRTDRMQRILDNGLFRLNRAVKIHNVIYSAINMKMQKDASDNKTPMTFTMNFSPDFSKVKLSIPINKVEEDYILQGLVPNTKLASLRAAILYHLPAFNSNQKLKSQNEETYQNIYIRYIRPYILISHIMDIVFEEITNYTEEHVERKIAIDQLLMRKATWAENIADKSRNNIEKSYLTAQYLGINLKIENALRFSSQKPHF